MRAEWAGESTRFFPTSSRAAALRLRLVMSSNAADQNALLLVKQIDTLTVIVGGMAFLLLLKALVTVAHIIWMFFRSKKSSKVSARSGFFFS